jgi:uncharacterized protein
MLLNQISDFIMIFLGLMVAALPFIVFGVSASVILTKYVSSERIAKYKSKNTFISHLQAMSIGLFLPVCECGNIPLANRLIKLGFKPSEIITFVLSAPILNPIVFITTFVAFNLDPNVAYIRLLAGGIIALFVGLLFSLIPQQDALLSKNFYSPNTHNHSHDNCEIDHDHSLVNQFKSEFFNVFKMLAIGALIAAVFQIFIPRDFILLFGNNQLISIIVLMVLAFVVSICSTIDAFFALSFLGSFSIGAILAFLIFGPMIDIKSLLMMNTIFKPKTLLLISIVVALLCVALGLSVDVFYKSNYIL